MDMSMPIATYHLIFLIFIILVNFVNFLYESHYFVNRCNNKKEQLLKNNYVFKEQLKTFKRTKNF